MTDVVVDPVADLAAARGVVDVFSVVWAADPGYPPVRQELVWALANSGAYVAAAWRDDRVVGASLGWVGLEHRRTLLHSHMTAVEPALRSSGVGLALKRHQRAWCLERDIGEIRWTFDPLVRRNAWFNLTKLGATIAGYAVDYYGPLDDKVNGGHDTDRVIASWDPGGDQATAAANGVWAAPDAEGLAAAGATVLLAGDDAGGPAHGDALRPGEPALCATPPDIEVLRGDDPGLAQAWRRALRETMGAALALGWRTVGISRSGWYVLEEPGPGR